MTYRSAQELLQRHGINYVATKKKSFTTDCPYCGNGYLSVTVKNDGVVWYCHHCGQGNGDWFEQKDTEHTKRMGNGKLGPEKAVYKYRDENGKRLFDVVRFGSPETGKDFTARLPDAKHWGIANTQRVLYRLDELVEDIASGHVVFVVEGEKDTETLRCHGVPATTNPFGAITEERQEKGNGWLDSYTESLREADIVICGDNDQKGHEHVRIVARELHGAARRLRILDLKNFWREIEQSDDISDWFEAGHAVEELWQIVETLPDYQPAEEPPSNGGNSTTNNSSTAKAIMNKTFPPVKYVVPSIIVEGLTLIAGKPKIGKSWLLLHAAVAVARGGFTLGEIKCREGDVLYCALEDNERRLQSRMRKLFGYDWEGTPRLTFRCEMPRLAEGGIAVIERWIDSVPEPRLIIIDTLAMVRAPKKRDQSNYEADYVAGQELRALANRRGIAIVLVHHLRKADSDDPYDLISGTLGLTGVPDSILVLKQDAKGYTLHGRGRDLMEIEKAMSFNTNNSCLWVILGSASEMRQSNERGAILAALEEAGESLGPNEIAAAIGAKPVNVRKLLPKLAREGKIEKVKYGQYVLRRTAAAA